MIEVNKGKCIKCYQCVSNCPLTALEVAEGEVRKRQGKFCMACLHCAAMCPEDAISFSGTPGALEQEAPVLGRGCADGFADDLKTHILNRRSFRRFFEKRVEREIIQEAIEMADWVPSAKNQHSTGYVVIEDDETREAIMEAILDYVKETGNSPEILEEYEGGNNVIMGNAKTLILAYAKEKGISPETDTAIAMTSIELYLQAKGIGTCWAGYLRALSNDAPQVRALLPEIPEGCRYYAAFMLGYPEDDNYLRMPNRLRRAKITWK